MAREDLVIVCRNFLLNVCETSIRNLDGMTIKDAVKWVISGDSCVQNAQELGSDISCDAAVPRGIKPKGSPAPAPVLSISNFSLIQGVNVDLFVFEFMSISAGSECILI